MRRLVLWVPLAAAVLAVASLGWIRFAPIDGAGWHVDPVAAPDEGQANAWRIGAAADAGVDAVAPVYSVSAEQLAARLDAVALAEDDTGRVAGAPEDLWTTYMQRSRWVRFPDFISVRALPLDDGRSTLAILSRSKYGRDDMGVNRARVERWLGELAALEE